MASEVDAEAISNDPSSHQSSVHHQQHDPSYQPYHDTSPPASHANISNPTPPMDPEAEDEPIQPPKDFNEHFPAHLPVPPFIHVQGVPNFRDMGGYRCPPPPSQRSAAEGTPASGKEYMVRKNILFRCAHPTQLTHHGATTLRDLGITNIYDLRSAPEIDKLAHSPPASPTETPMSPSKPKPFSPKPLDTSKGYIVIPGVPRLFTPVYAEEDYSPVALARKLQWYTAANSPDKTYSDGFVNAYRDIATYGASGGAYATILRQTVKSAENMARNPALGRRRRPTSAVPNLDFLIQYQEEHESPGVTPGQPRAVSRGNGGATNANAACDTNANADTTASANTNSNDTTAPSREKSNGGLIFHCTAGKDRTGVLAAVIHTLLGVDVDTICWEYAITEPGLGSWRDLFIDRISRGGLGGPNRDALNREKRDGEEKVGGGKAMMSRAEAARICGSRAGNMRAFLSQILEGEFGGAEAYLKEMVGLSEEEIEALKEGLVVEVADGDDVTRCVGIVGWTMERGMEADYDEVEVVNGEENARKAGAWPGAESGKLGLDESAGREKEEKVMAG